MVADVAARVRAWDPQLRATTRAVRAAVVVPVVFAVALGIGNPQTSVFALFGAFSLTVMVDFIAPTRQRVRGYILLVFAGFGFITVGTLSSGQTATAVVVMGAVAFAVLFGSLVSPLFVQGTPAVLLTLVLPVSLPAPSSAIPHRLLGYALAAVVVVPVVLLVRPTPYRSRLRQALASTAEALAAVADSHATGQAAPALMVRAQHSCDDLTQVFEETAYLPIGAAPGDEALWRLVSRLRRVETEMAITESGPPHHLELVSVRTMSGEGASVLRLVAALVRGDGGDNVERLRDVLSETTSSRNESVAESVDRIVRRQIAGPDSNSPVQEPAVTADGRDLDSLDPMFRARALARTLTLVGEDAIGGLETLADRSWAGRIRVAVELWKARCAPHLRADSVWLHNSVRGALGLALAVLVAQVTGLQHGFWIVLGTLSVLRSNASGTGTTALRAIVGTAAGVVLGSVLIWVVGDSAAALWSLLPIVVFVSGFAAAVSFAAGQAGFTMTVLTAFHLLEHGGLGVGLLRAEDVAIGCAVALGVGLLFWPRGASRVLGAALCEALETGAGYLASALDRILAPGCDVDLAVSGRAARDALGRADDCFREYLLERGEKTVDASCLTTLFVGANELSVGGDLLAGLPVRKLDPDAGDATAVKRASTVLRAAYADDRDWYGRIGQVLAGQRDGVAPVVGHDRGVAEHLDAALRDAARRRDGDAVRMTLRMLWADEELKVVERLQAELAEAVTKFASRLRWTDLDRSGRPSARSDRRVSAWRGHRRRKEACPDPSRAAPPPG